MFEFGLFGAWAVSRGGERVHAGEHLAGAAHTAEVFSAPVHGDEGLRQADVGRALQRHQDGAAFAGHVHQITVFQATAFHVLRIELHRRLGHMAEESAQRAGARHAVPLVAQAACGEREGVTRFARLGQGHEGQGGEAGFAILGWEDAVFVEALLALGFAGLDGPLLRALLLEHRVGQAGDVEVAPARGLAVFVPD